MKNTTKRIGLFTFLITVVLGLFAGSITTTNAADVGTPLSSSAFTPTPEPVKFLNIWNTNGYGLQPTPVTYKLVGNQMTLNTDAGRSIWSVMGGVFDAPHYRWYKSVDGIAWSAVSESDNGHRKNLPIQMSQVGRTWYQLDTQYWNYLTGWVAKTHIYSNVAEVNAVNEPTDATGVTVTADTNYLFNNDQDQVNTTYAHATVDPISSTGNITWSVDNTDLATVNDTGKVTANNNGLSGVVTVTATFHNMNTSFVVGSTYIRVGGGLENQTVNAGQAATFELQGDNSDLANLINQGKVKVEWYKKAPGKTKAEYLGKGTNTSYMTAGTAVSDNGTQYQAKITIKEGSSSKMFKTNWATLSVIY